MTERTERQWGYYRVLHTVGDHTKVKELTVDPGALLSMQRHWNRAEHWFVAEGEATVYTLENDEPKFVGKYGKHETIHIERTQWHRLCNESTEPLKVIEIQYGSSCEEEDIERKK